ncbi:MAG: hypothetical protein JW846_07220 [Dehalococcoidia bacterium]|nr:hypothetical protein [Dehalococcoidia bacterium]
MPGKDKGNSAEKKPVKGQVAATGTPVAKGKYGAEPAAMEGKHKKAKAHKDKRGRGTQ